MPKNTPNLKKISSLVRSRKAITIDNNLVLRVLCFSDMRDFYEDIHGWGYSRDFTYQTTQNDYQRFLKLYLKETFLD